MRRNTFPLWPEPGNPDWGNGTILLGEAKGSTDVSLDPVTSMATWLIIGGSVLIAAGLGLR